MVQYLEAIPDYDDCKVKNPPFAFSRSFPPRLSVLGVGSKLKFHEALSTLLLV